MVAKQVFLVAALTVSMSASAEQGADCEVRVIQALHQGRGMDPRIDRLRPYLEQPPFTAWSRFVLVDVKRLHLDQGGTGTFKLPNGNEVSLHYLEHVIGKDTHRLRLRMQVQRQNQKALDTTFVLDENGMVLQAGQRFGSGMLVLGLSCDLLDT